MKKIFLLFIALTALHAKELSQKFLLDELKKDFEDATVYEKFKNILVRKALASETVITYTNDGMETKNTAKEREYVVKNLTTAGEQYILSAEKLLKRYKFVKKHDEIWSIYKPTGKIRAIMVDEILHKRLNVPSAPFYIITSWGEKMVVKQGDYLVTPPALSEVYRIASKEFFETYKKY